MSAATGCVVIYVFGLLPGTRPWPFLTIGLQSALAIHDLVTRGRIHPVTLSGVGLVVLGIPGVFNFPSSE